MANTQRFGRIALWSKESDGDLVYSGKLTFTKDQLNDMLDYLESQETTDTKLGPTHTLDIALYWGEEGDRKPVLTGTISSVYVKQDAGKAQTSTRKTRRM